MSPDHQGPSGAPVVSPRPDRPPPTPPGPSHIRVQALEDPVCDQLGFKPTHPYVEWCWLPVIGPSSTWALHRLASGLEAHPQGYDLDLAGLGRDLGLGGGTGRRAPIQRTLTRLADFGLARFVAPDSYQVRRRVPALTQRQVHRLGPGPAAAHRRLVEATGAQANPLLGAALAYAARGWPVLPLRPGAKVPDGRLVPHGLSDATCDQARIRAWWAASPTANVAIRTGVGIDVIDLDGPAGRQSFTNVVPESYSPAAMVATGRGWHLYFASAGLPTRAGLLPGVDVRGQGGYVVAPPSAHPDGGRYTFVEAATGERLERLPDTALPEVPAWLGQLCRPGPAPVRPAEPVRLGADAYARAALQAECQAVATTSEGARNDRLNRAAFSVGTLVGAGVLVDEEAAGRLLGAGLAAGLPEAEARATIASGLRAGQNQPRQLHSTRSGAPRSVAGGRAAAAILERGTLGRGTLERGSAASPEGLPPPAPASAARRGPRR